MDKEKKKRLEKRAREKYEGLMLAIAHVANEVEQSSISPEEVAKYAPDDLRRDKLASLIEFLKSLQALDEL